MNQTLKDIEIIIVNDSSTDKSLEICKEYEKKYENIKVICKEKNEGLGLARNTGIKYTNGEYIAFIDSDDYIDIDMYEKLYKKAQKTDADVVYGGMKTINPSGNIRSKIGNPFKEDIQKGKDILKVLYNMLNIKNEQINCYMGMSVCKAIYRKSIFNENNIWFVSERQFISEDYIFHLDYIPKCKVIAFDDSVYYYYCDNENQSLTRSYKSNKFEENKKLRKELIRKTKNINIYEEVKKGIDDLFIGSVRGCIKQEERCQNRNIAIQNIKKIMEDEELQDCIKKYESTNLKQKVIDMCIKNGYSLMAYYIVKISRYIENS